MLIRIGTGEIGGTFYTQGLALKAALERTPRLPPIEVVESRAAVSIENAVRLDAGEIELGVISAPWVASAARGTHPFDRAIDLRVAAPMNVGPNFFIARADSGLRKVSDLRGKKVAVGMNGGGMAEHAEAMCGALGIGADDVTRIFVDFAEGAEMLASGQVDAQFQCPIPNQVMTDLSERIRVRVLSYDPPHLEAALKSIPLDRRFVMRKGAFRGHDEDLPQLGVLNLLVTHARVDDRHRSRHIRARATASALCGPPRAVRDVQGPEPGCGVRRRGPPSGCSARLQRAGSAGIRRGPSRPAKR
jgi:uncharacterized protein